MRVLYTTDWQGNIIEFELTGETEFHYEYRTKQGTILTVRKSLGKYSTDKTAALEYCLAETESLVNRLRKSIDHNIATATRLRDYLFGKK